MTPGRRSAKYPGKAGLGSPIRRAFQPGIGPAAHEKQRRETPFVVDQGIDQETLAGVVGTVEFVIFGGKLGEIVDGFVEHYLLLGIDDVLEGVAAGCGFTGLGARAGGNPRSPSYSDCPSACR
jgi:hypothetical protein